MRYTTNLRDIEMLKLVVNKNSLCVLLSKQGLSMVKSEKMYFDLHTVYINSSHLKSNFVCIHKTFTKHLNYMHPILHFFVNLCVAAHQNIFLMLDVKICCFC